MKWFIGCLTLLAVFYAAEVRTIKVRDGVGLSSRDVMDICMTSDAQGWAVGDGGKVYRRTDSLSINVNDSAWVPIDLGIGPQQADFNFQGVCFIGKEIGWIVGYTHSGVDRYKGIILKTENGGASWETQVNPLIGTPDERTPLREIKMNEVNGIIIGYIVCGRDYLMKWDPFTGQWIIKKDCGSDRNQARPVMSPMRY